MPRKAPVTNNNKPAMKTAALGSSAGKSGATKTAVRVSAFCATTQTPPRATKPFWQSAISQPNPLARSDRKNWLFDRAQFRFVEDARNVAVLFRAHQCGSEFRIAQHPA